MAIRAPPRLSETRPAMAPICSCVEAATRRSLRPIRAIGWAMSGAVTAATSVRTGSIQSIAATRATRVAISRSETVDRRVRASLMKAKSVVKRWVERRRALAAELGEVGVDEVGVERRLHVGLDPGHDPVGQDDLGVKGETLHGRDGDDEGGRVEERAGVARREGVEGPGDQDG